MIPGIAPVITRFAGEAGVLEGTITVGDFEGYAYGYLAAGNFFGAPPMGALSGAAAACIGREFVWGFGMGYAFAAPGTPIEAVLYFQGGEYTQTYDPETELYMWVFGPEIAGWPTSGTHPFQIILP